MFPFLIGTVRTGGNDEKRGDENLVSIPHRYGKNMIETDWYEEFEYGFHSS